MQLCIDRSFCISVWLHVATFPFWQSSRSHSGPRKSPILYQKFKKELKRWKGGRFCKVTGEKYIFQPIQINKIIFQFYLITLFDDERMLNSYAWISWHNAEGNAILWYVLYQSICLYTHFLHIILLYDLVNVSQS